MDPFNFCNKHVDEKNKIISSKKTFYAPEHKKHKLSENLSNYFEINGWYDYEKNNCNIVNNILSDEKFKNYKKKRKAPIYVDVRKINPILFDNEKNDSNEKNKNEKNELVDLNEKEKNELVDSNENEGNEKKKNELIDSNEKNEKKKNDSNEEIVSNSLKSNKSSKIKINICKHKKEKYKCKKCNFDICVHGIVKKICLSCKNYHCIHNVNRSTCEFCTLKNQCDVINFVKNFNYESYSNKN